jgi:ABC-type polysaccharide/polyol phosphate export permease
MINNFKKSITLSFFELKLKNQRTYLGFIWYLLQPAFMFFVLFYVKNNLLNLQIDNFLPYLLIGVLMIHFFISSTNLMTTAITSNYNLFESRKIDPNIFILSRFMMSLWMHLFEAIVAIIILTFLGYWFSFMYLIILIIFSVFVFSVGKILSVMSAKLFDLAYVWNYFCQIIWFITPVYFVSVANQFIINVNPLNYFIDLARIAVYDYDSTNSNLIITCTLLSAVTFLAGEFYFNKNKKFITERNK